MIAGVGVDIEDVARFKEEDNNFLNLIFTKKEIDYCRNKKDPSKSYAGKFCAKEAIIKAYRKKIGMKNIEVNNLKSGKLEIKLNRKRDNKIKCSISHTNNYAIAFAVIDEGRDSIFNKQNEVDGMDIKKLKKEIKEEVLEELRREWKELWNNNVV